MPKVLEQYREEGEIPVFFEESEAQIVNVLSDMRHRFCYVENEDGDTVLHLLYRYADSLDVPLYVVDLKQLLNLEAEGQCRCLAELSFRLRLSEGICCVRYETEAGNSVEMAAERWEMLERI